MKNCDEKEITLFATSIALELTKGKTPEEINEIRIILSQVHHSVCSILALTPRKKH